MEIRKIEVLLYIYIYIYIYVCIYNVTLPSHSSKKSQKKMYDCSSAALKGELTGEKSASSKVLKYSVEIKQMAMHLLMQTCTYSSAHLFVT